VKISKDEAGVKKKCTNLWDPGRKSGRKGEKES
jgi:hypothetical protein